ncbi:Crp/Fnr family transcriptional regulator [Hyunsoonleella ulvae]|uniref:Crp/Fnr family transcriptional regulator n=1 Tax=Hyunsoonleella ulvae TaxID=2799948 RepID=UPI00193A4646|nr:cyclic nucleotide-binding domain-containing protein [Hyunsoonleella ulvae]
MNNLIALFNSILPISREEELLIQEHLSIDLVSKKDCYNEIGKICNKLGFVEHGIFKVLSYKDSGDEYIKYFVTQGHFLIDLNSFFYNTPSSESIVALNDSKVYTMSRSAYNLLEHKVSNFSKIINELKQKALLEKFTIKNEMLVDDALTKYSKFIKRYPTLSQSISQKHIALHLGITEYTLSRIRAKKQFLAI